MRKFQNNTQTLFNSKKSVVLDQKGQAFVEYLILLVGVVAVCTTLSVALKKSTKTLWILFAEKITAPCPSCEAPREVARIRRN